MLDHIKLHVADAERSKAFYEHALAPLGHRVIMEPVAGVVVAFGTKFPEFWITRSDAPTVAHVDAGYYGAFVLDPDGNNVEAVHHGF